MPTKKLTTKNISAITTAFLQSANLTASDKAIDDMIVDLKKRLQKQSFTYDAIPEVAMEITDIIEQTCDDHAIIINNPDYDEAIKDGEDPDTLSKIYGDLYFTLEDTIQDQF